MASLLISPDDSELTLLEHSANFFPDSLGNEPFSTIPDLLNAMCHPPFDTFPVRGKLAQPPPISPHLSQTHDFHPNNYVRVVFDMVWQKSRGEAYLWWLPLWLLVLSQKQVLSLFIILLMALCDAMHFASAVSRRPAFFRVSTGLIQ